MSYVIKEEGVIINDILKDLTLNTFKAKYIIIFRSKMTSTYIIKCSILIICTLSLLFLMQSCTDTRNSSLIIGKWKVDQSNDMMMEFFKDGTARDYKQYGYGIYSGVKVTESKYKIHNGDDLELVVEKGRSIPLKVKFSDENSMTLSLPNGEVAFTLTRVR